eukprot:266406_1
MSDFKLLKSEIACTVTYDNTPLVIDGNIWYLNTTQNTNNNQLICDNANHVGVNILNLITNYSWQLQWMVNHLDNIYIFTQHSSTYYVFKFNIT